jgi:outer membrane lipoprotein carrier protein
MRFIVLAVALTQLLTGAATAQPRPAADALARSLQQRYQGIRDFSASFVHTYRGAVLKTQAREQGTLVVKKPGMMRFVYTAPEKKEFVSDGRKIYSYIPQDRQVIVSPVPPDNQASTPALFLSGKGDISRDFVATYAEPAVPGAIALKLTPKREEPEYEYFVLTVDPATLQWRALATRDRQGGESTLIFSNLKENQGVSDNEFGFRIPRGVDVIDGTRN